MRKLTESFKLHQLVVVHVIIRLYFIVTRELHVSLVDFVTIKKYIYNAKWDIHSNITFIRIACDAIRYLIKSENCRGLKKFVFGRYL